MSNRQYLTAEQVREVLAQLRGPVYISAMLQWRAGLRVSESLAIKSSDVDLEAGTLTVQFGKGGVQRTVPLHSELAQLFRSLDRPPADRPYVDRDRSTVYRALRRAGCPGNHALRHSAARHWLNAGRPVHQIQKVLGHERLETTLEYLDLVAWDQGFMQGIP